MKSRYEKIEKIKGPLYLVLITLLVYLCFKYLLGLIFPFLVAYFLAWIIRPVTETLYRRFKIPRIIGGSGALFLLIAVFGTSIFLLIKILLKQTIAFIRNLPIYMDDLASKLDNLCNGCDNIFGFDCGTMRSFLDDNLIASYNKARTSLVPELTEHTIAITVGTLAFIGIFLIVFVAAVLIAKDLPAFREKYEKSELYQNIHIFTSKLAEAGIAYIRAQLIIMIIIAVICVFGLMLISNEYAFLIGIGIAIMDALPVLGIGLVLIPWTIAMLLNGKLYQAAILFTIFLICQIVREILTPKLIGNSIGIKPLFTLISIYIGVRLFSIIGFILGPIGLVIIITSYKVITEKSQEVANTRDITYNDK
jgi:sporulation integral membrane protein YtvI